MSRGTPSWWERCRRERQDQRDLAEALVVIVVVYVGLALSGLYLISKFLDAIQ